MTTDASPRLAALLAAVADHVARVPTPAAGLGPRAATRADSPAAALLLSPHLDDAVLSCAALGRRLAGLGRVVVVTAFTHATPPPWTRPARSFLQQCGEPDAERLFADRRAEDVAVLDQLGFDHEHLGLQDALFRRRGGRPRSPSVYPTYRFDIARGRVSRADTGLRHELVEAVRDRVARWRPGVVLAPMGIGSHVDHLLVRDCARAALATGDGAGPPLAHYSDFPYSRTRVPDRRFVAANHLVPHPWLEGRADATVAMAGYETQFRALFPDGRVETVPEVYWLPTELA